ncbi:DUF1127 domain-containing protein [Marivita sp. S2033]|uniref:DUF1127 domain-containing protein n=1 Tax=Marivita sp. S2033 TaxID=3373187 RepID=UPI0039826EEF
MAHATQVSRSEFAGTRAPLIGAVSRVKETVTQWAQRRRTRSHLALLDDRLLNDIGMDRLIASEETNRTFWRA